MITRQRIVTAVVVGTALLCGVAAFSAAGKPSSDRAAAERDAQRLLRVLVLPSGAIRLAIEPTGDGGVLRAPFSTPGVFGLVDRHRFWAIRSSLSSVIAFIKTHRPSGSEPGLGDGSQGGPGIPSNESLMFSFPATATAAMRWLNVDAVALPDGGTGLRADTQVPIVRSHELVPSDVGVLRISWRDSRNPTIVVTNRNRIRAIARAVDRYPLGADGVCVEGFIPPSITLSFLRARNGPASARVAGVTRGAPDAACEPSMLWVRGRGTQFLVEDSKLLDEVNRILGTRLN